MTNVELGRTEFWLREGTAEGSGSDITNSSGLMSQSRLFISCSLSLFKCTLFVFSEVRVQDWDIGFWLGLELELSSMVFKDPLKYFESQIIVMVAVVLLCGLF